MDEAEEGTVFVTVPLNKEEEVEKVEDRDAAEEVAVAAGVEAAAVVELIEEEPIAALENDVEAWAEAVVEDMEDTIVLVATAEAVDRVIETSAAQTPPPPVATYIRPSVKSSAAKILGTPVMSRWPEGSGI